MAEITWEEFERVDMRVGRVVEASEFPEARNPSLLLKIDFGPQIGLRQSAAAVADRYTVEQMRDRLVVAVVNFPPKQIANHMSEALVLAGVNADGSLCLLQPDDEVELGAQVR